MEVEQALVRAVSLAGRIVGWLCPLEIGLFPTAISVALLITTSEPKSIPEERQIPSLPGCK